MGSFRSPNLLGQRKLKVLCRWMDLVNRLFTTATSAPAPSTPPAAARFLEVLGGFRSHG